MLHETSLIKILLIRNRHVPAIAIFIHGLNEWQTEPHYTKEMSSIFEAYNYKQYKLFRGFIEKSSLMHAVIPDGA